MRNRNHAEIVKAGGDAVVSVRWQLCDGTNGLSDQRTAIKCIAARARITWAADLKALKFWSQARADRRC
jgi:hypothetical protein